MLISGAIVFIVMVAAWAGLVITGGKSIEHGTREGWPD